MAHSCPECMQACYCCGDMDDCDFGDSPEWCICCLGREFDDDDEDDFVTGPRAEERE